MRRLFLAIVLLAFGINECTAQLNNVGIGYGSITFPETPGINASSVGGVAYLEIGSQGLSPVEDGSGGFSLLIAGDSRVAKLNADYGNAGVGFVAFQDIPVIKNHPNLLRVGVFVGGFVNQLYENNSKADTFQGVDLNPLHTPVSLKKTNFQPYGGVRLHIGFLQVQYAPVSKSLTVGFRLYKG